LTLLTKAQDYYNESNALRILGVTKERFKKLSQACDVNYTVKQINNKKRHVISSGDLEKVKELNTKIAKDF
jgi:hypothetical protein